MALTRGSAAEVAAGFVGRFYRSLLAQGEVDVAVHDARLAVLGRLASEIPIVVSRHLGQKIVEV